MRSFGKQPSTPPASIEIRRRDQTWSIFFVANRRTTDARPQKQSGGSEYEAAVSGPAGGGGRSE